MFINPHDPHAIDRIVAHLTSGELLIIPTETVYGLVADATNPRAIEKMFALKKRPKDRPLSVLIADQRWMPQWSSAIPQSALQLAEAFWPGPLTLIVPKALHVLDTLTAHQPTIGLRVPAHPIALAILQAFQGGLAAPSANLFSAASAITAEQAAQYFPKEVWIVKDDVPILGVASTIIDCTMERPKILREGVITTKNIVEKTGIIIV